MSEENNNQTTNNSEKNQELSDVVNQNKGFCTHGLSNMCFFVATLQTVTAGIQVFAHQEYGRAASSVLIAATWYGVGYFFRKNGA